MAYIEEWRWEKSDENPLQPFWDEFIRQLMEEHEMIQKEELIEEIMIRLKE